MALLHTILTHLVSRPALSVPLHIANRTRQWNRQSVEVMLEPGSFVQKTFGARSFNYFAPELWNGLPHDIWAAPTLTVFKSLLKTHLFRKHYSVF